MIVPFGEQYIKRNRSPFRLGIYWCLSIVNQLFVCEHNFLFIHVTTNIPRTRRELRKKRVPCKRYAMIYSNRNRNFSGSSSCRPRPHFRLNFSCGRLNSPSGVRRGAYRARWECTAPPRPSTAAHSIWWCMRFLKQKCISRVILGARYARGFYVREFMYTGCLREISRDIFYLWNCILN